MSTRRRLIQIAGATAASTALPRIAAGQMPVISTLARGFATFDYWFCEVPSQTFTNRSFFHAATASGYVIKFPPSDAFPILNKAQTLFERLEARGLTWRIYCDSPSPISFTGIIHASRLRPRFTQAMDIIRDTSFSLFPGLRTKT